MTMPLKTKLDSRKASGDSYAQSLKIAQEKMVFAFRNRPASSEIGNASPGSVILSWVGVARTQDYSGQTAILRNGHQKSVSFGLEGNICHPCCYTRELGASFGKKRTLHPNFKGDYEACLNLWDGFDDLSGGQKTLNEKKVLQVYALDDKCTTMTGYFDMAVSAFENGGCVVYIIGIMWVVWLLLFDVFVEIG